MTKRLRKWDGRRITALRERLGSVTRPLSRRDLVRLVNEELPEDIRATESSLRRWEEENVQPPYEAADILARKAGLSFEEFALGSKREPGNLGMEMETGETLDERHRRELAALEKSARERRQRQKGETSSGHQLPRGRRPA